MAGDRAIHEQLGLIKRQSQLAQLVHVLGRILQEDSELGRRLEQVIRELALGGSVHDRGDVLKIQIRVVKEGARAPLVCRDIFEMLLAEDTCMTIIAGRFRTPFENWIVNDCVPDWRDNH